MDREPPARREKGRPSERQSGMLGAIGPAARLLGIGWFFVLAILGCAGLGWWFGQRFTGTMSQAIATLAGLALGVALAGFGGFQFVKQTIREGAGEEEGGPSSA